MIAYIEYCAMCLLKGIVNFITHLKDVFLKFDHPLNDGPIMPDIIPECFANNVITIWSILIKKKEVNKKQTHLDMMIHTDRRES